MKKRNQRLLQIAVATVAVSFAAADGWAADSQCATVKIEIEQELTLERQAFDACMKVNNGLSSISLEDVRVDVTFVDANGSNVLATSDSQNTNALFFIRLDTISGISDVSGSGQIGPSTSAEIHWLIIPAYGAAGAEPQGALYYVGATLSYTLDGTAYTMEVSPDYIYVLPMPKLVLDYFLPYDVYGDDAFTSEIEAPVPFSLGVRVSNSGYGTAHKVKIESAQPRIVDNSSGLLVGFRITGTEVDGSTVNDSLLVDFGDIEPNRAGLGRWIMECTLSGRFEEFDASYTHSDELGGELTSLIEALNTHVLVRDVLVDLPGRDAIRDFLALNGSDYRVYESDSVDESVEDVSDVSTFSPLGSSGSEVTYRLTVPETIGPLYVKIGYTNADNEEVAWVQRSDGKTLPSANAWFSKHRPRGTSTWEQYFNLFDVNGGGEYTVTFRYAEASNQAPVLHYIGPRITRVGQYLGVMVLATDANRAWPSLETTLLPSGASFVDEGDGEGLFGWTPVDGQEGIYPVRFTASDGVLTDDEVVKIYVGRVDEPTNSAGLPLSLEGWSVLITNIEASSTSDMAVVQWLATPGIAYDLYASDDRLGRSMNWFRLMTNHQATDMGERWVDTSLSRTHMWRFYQTVLNSEGPQSNRLWGVIRRDVAGSSQTLISLPLREDGRFDGAFGRALAGVLAGDNAGPGDLVGDEVGLLNSDGSWSVLYLDAFGAWREADGRLSVAEAVSGQGMVLIRNATNGCRLTFAGAVGNDRSRQVVVSPGWNLITLSEGCELAVSNAFDLADNGGPVGGTTESNADLLVLQTDDGLLHRLMFVQGWGAPYDGNWVDLIDNQVSTLRLKPGQAYYYYRQTIGGEMRIEY